MDRCATRQRKRNGLFGAALALLLCSANASGAGYGPPPTLAEAHEFLAATFQRYGIGYTVWYGPGLRDNYRGLAGYYGGRDCFSELGTDRSGRAFAIDWSLISAVEGSGGEATYVTGQLLRTSQDTGGAGGRRFTNFHLYFPDARVSRSVSNALELLRSSCAKRSKFD